MIVWKKYLEYVIDDVKDKEYICNHIEEINIITLANKLDMSYDFYIKLNMHAIQWK